MNRQIRIRFRGFATTAAAVTFLALGAWAAVERLPPGTYTTTLTEADIPASFPPEIASMLVGNWEVEFSETGALLVTKDAELVVVGRYRSNPARVIVQDEEGRLPCLPPGAGVYAWVLDGERLTLTEVQDTCAGRALVLTSHPLQKVQ
jgi:hypothetical protein